MARQIHIVEKPKQGRVAPSAVPDDVKTDVEETYAALKGTDRNATITFGDKKELAAFVGQARTYCETRTVPTDEKDEEGNVVYAPAPLAFRKVGMRGIADNVLYFTVKDPDSEAS